MDLARAAYLCCLRAEIHTTDSSGNETKDYARLGDLPFRRSVLTHYRCQKRKSEGDLYRSTEAQCRGCPQKKSCTQGPYRRLFVHWQEPARQAVRALAGRAEYQRSQRARYKVEDLIAELKQQVKLRRVRLRPLWTSLSSSISRQRRKI